MSLPICFSLVHILFFFLQYYDHDFDKLLLGYFLVNFYRINTFTRRMYSLEFLWWIYVLWRNWLYNLCKKKAGTAKNETNSNKVFPWPTFIYSIPHIIIIVLKVEFTCFIFESEKDFAKSILMDLWVWQVNSGHIGTYITVLVNYLVNIFSSVPLYDISKYTQHIHTSQGSEIGLYILQ